MVKKSYFHFLCLLFLQQLFVSGAFDILWLWFVSFNNKIKPYFIKIAFVVTKPVLLMSDLWNCQSVQSEILSCTKNKYFEMFLLLFQIMLIHYKFCSALKQLSTNCGHMLIEWWCFMGMQFPHKSERTLHSVEQSSVSLTTSGWWCNVNDRKSGKV